MGMGMYRIGPMPACDSLVCLAVGRLFVRDAADSSVDVIGGIQSGVHEQILSPALPQPSVQGGQEVLGAGLHRGPGAVLHSGVQVPVDVLQRSLECSERVMDGAASPASGQGPCLGLGQEVRPVRVVMARRPWTSIAKILPKVRWWAYIAMSYAGAREQDPSSGLRNEMFLACASLLPTARLKAVSANRGSGSWPPLRRTAAIAFREGRFLPR
jgi:hypothetical protein